jgi:hypothetical protein
MNRVSILSDIAAISGAAEGRKAGNIRLVHTARGGAIVRLLDD